MEIRVGSILQWLFCLSPHSVRYLPRISQAPYCSGALRNSVPAYSRFMPAGLDASFQALEWGHSPVSIHPVKNSGIFNPTNVLTRSL